MKVYLDGTEIDFLNAPAISDQIETGDGSIAIAVKGNVAAPNDQIVTVTTGGTQIYKGLYRSLSVQDVPRISSLACNSFRELTSTKVLAYQYEGSADDVLTSLLGEANVTDLLGNPGCPVTATVSIDATGLFLADALDLFCEATKTVWFVDVASGALRILDPTAATTAPNDLELPPGNCNSAFRLIDSVQYEVSPVQVSDVIVQGKNGILELAGSIIDDYEEEVGEQVGAGSTQRIFPLLEGRTRILSIDVTPLGSFTVTVEPASSSVADGSSTAVAFTVTVTAVGAFSDAVTLSISVPLSGHTYVFNDTIVTPGNSTTLTVTPTDGTWTDGDTNEEGTFTVTGTSGSRTASDTGTISITPGCEPGTFDHFVFSADCSGVPSNCCDLPFFPDQVAISWSVEFFDTCGNSMSTDEGIMYISQGASCTVVENGENTFSNPYTGITYSVLEEGGADCNCIVA